MGVDAVVYTASAETRPGEALQDLLACLRAGANVVSTSFYALLYPPITPPQLLEQVQSACREGDSSLFVSGIDPGWALDILPLLLSGVVSDIREVRCQEIFNYALYDQPEVVRKVIGFGEPMDRLPVMLHDFALKMVWEPMVRLLGEGLGHPVDAVETFVERRPLARTIQVAGMGRFDEGTQGRFASRCAASGKGRRCTSWSVTHIDDACAPLAPSARGTWLSSRPDPRQSGPARQHPRRRRLRASPAGGGNATAANRIVNSIVAVCDAKPGILTLLDLPRSREPGSCVASCGQHAEAARRRPATLRR
jgi:hypothetical protein